MKDISSMLIHALKIEERRQILSDFHSNNDNIAIWRSIKSRMDEQRFEKKLRLLGYTHTEFNNTIQNLNEICDTEIIKKLSFEVKGSEWYKTLEEIIDFGIATKYDISKLSNKADILLSMYCFVEWAINKLEDFLTTCPNIIVDTNIIGIIRQNFYSELLNLSSKTLVYEFNERKKQSKSRYTIENFICSCFGNIESILEFFSEYPVLLRRLAVKTKFILNSMENMFQKIDQNIDSIMTKIPGIQSKKITSLSWGVGDTHAKGNSVVILVIGNKKIVYKPHNSDIQKKYNEFLNWLNETSTLMPLYVTNDFYADDFSVSEFIEYESCKSVSQVERFYLRMGQHLAILYMLGGTDMHCENIVAMDEYPIIIDHETFFNNNYHVLNETKTVFHDAERFLGESLINTGILPILIKGIDFGALAKRDNNQSVKFWTLVNDDDENIHFEYVSVHPEENNNIPLINNEKVDYFNYRLQLLKGFKNTYSFFKNNITELREKINSFSGIKVRIIIQATQNYADLYQYISHPKYMYDMLSLEKLFENIWIDNKGSTKHYLYEVMDAHNCDIPIFYTKTNTKDLISSNGEVIEDFFKYTSLDIVKNRLDKIDSEFKMQFAILKNSLKLVEHETEQFNAACTQRIKFLRRKVCDLDVDINKIICNINSQIEQRLYIDDITTTWIELSDDNNVTFALSNYSNGTNGLGKYLIKCKKIGIELSDKLLTAMNSTINMVTVKDPYTSYNIYSSNEGVLSNLWLLYECHLSTGELKYLEKIFDIVMYLNKILENGTDKISILNLASIIELLSVIFESTGDFRTQNLLKTLGKNLIIQLNMNGIYNVAKNEFFNIGNLIKAFALLSICCSEDAFSEYYDKLKKIIIDENNWSKKGIYINNTLLGLENGHIQRLGEKLIYVLEIKEDVEFDVIVDKITDIIMNKKYYSSDTLRDGTAASLNFLLSYSRFKENLKVNDTIDNIVYQIISGYKINKSFRVKCASVLPNVGLVDGLIGVAYSLLRYKDKTIESPIL